MTVDQLSSILEKKYAIKGIVDLADLSTTPQAAYKFFYSVYQTEFAHNDRIVLYSSKEVPESFLEYLHKVVNFVDISNWFILLCTSNTVADVSSRYSSDPVPFQQLTVALNETNEFSNGYILPDTICAIPWMNAEIRSTGDITPCCMTDGISLGNINNTTINDAFNNYKIQDLRNQLLAGEKPSCCDRCWNTESKGLSSIRMHNAKRLTKQFFLSQLDKPSITSIDIKFNNTCNFKCRICNPQSSSLFAAEQKKFLGIDIRAQNKWEESDSFINQVVEHLPNLSNIDMFGGEPFLIKKFASVLQLAVEQGHAKNIRLHYNSNGSIWPAEFVPYWKHFKEVDIHFSIDAIGKRFELQRGGSWNEVESNILKLKDLNFPNLTINVMPTISIMSVYYIDEVYAWADANNFNVFISNLSQPPQFSIKNITAEAKELIIQKFKNHPNKEIQNIVNAVRGTTPTDGKLFRESTEWFDSVRQESFIDSHFEIAKAMGFV